MLTRLNPQQCTELHRKLVRHTFLQLMEDKVAPLALYVGGEDSSGFFTELVSGFVPQASIVAQTGEGLGERMHDAFEQTLLLSSPVILVGSDCPFFSQEYFITAIDLLESGQDAVLGPAEDGGYVMLGLKRVNPLLFQDIEWGSPRVLAQTRERLLQLAWQWREMPSLLDIDEPADLVKAEKMGVL